jgi:hypothetical protein
VGGGMFDVNTSLIGVHGHLTGIMIYADVHGIEVISVVKQKHQRD